MLSPELDIDTTIVSLILFAVIALFVRPPMKIVVFALIGGVVFAALNRVSDMIAYWADWWRFPFVQNRYPSLMFYIPALFFYGAGIAGLIGWWLRNKFGIKSAMVFLPLFGILGLVRGFVEWFVKSGTIMVWGNGFVPTLALYLDWVLLGAVAYFIVWELDKLTTHKTAQGNPRNAMA